MLSYKLKQIFNKHFEKNYITYFIVIVILTIGISIGAVLSKIYDSSQKGALVSYLDMFFKIIKENNIDTGLIVKYSLLNNLKVIFLIWILGITVIGIPITLGIIIYKGFVLGFTVSFLFMEFGFKGFLISLLAILPQNIFIVSGMIIITVISLGFSAKILNKKSRNGLKYTYKNGLASYTIGILSTSILIIVGSLIEAYITPYLLNLIF